MVIKLKRPLTSLRALYQAAKIITNCLTIDKKSFKN